MESSKTARGLSTAHRGCDAISRASSSRRVSSSTAESFLGHRRCAVTTNELNTGLWSLCVSARVEPYDVCDTSRPRHNTRSHHAGVRFFFSSFAFTAGAVGCSEPSPGSSASPAPEYVCVPGRYLYVGANATGASVQPANALPAARSSDSWSAPSSEAYRLARSAAYAERTRKSSRAVCEVPEPASAVAIAESRPRTWSSARFRR